MTSTPTTTTSIDPATRVGMLALSVADLEPSVSFYTGPIGLHVLDRSPGQVTLGPAGYPLLILDEHRGADPWPRGGRSYTGLYHFAILLPTRPDLGRWLRHWLDLGYPMPGQGDHLVSEALYLEDPDGHGIEIYRDRPRSQWRWEGGHIQMGTGPVDVRGLIEDADREGLPFHAMPSGTRLGHMHLQVGNIVEARRFYAERLGFDVVAEMPTALFISAGGYHHHIGMNTWHSLNAGPAPAGSVRLQYFTVDLPSDEALQAVLDRLDGLRLEQRRMGTSITVEDPWGNPIVLRVAPSHPQ